MAYDWGGGQGPQYSINRAKGYLWKEMNPDAYAGAGGGNGGGGNGGGFPRPDVWGDNPPDPFRSQQHKQSLSNYMDWVKWKRQSMKNLITQYRENLPKQIGAYKDASYAALPEQGKELWGEMHTNLQQRGLDDSGSFLGGAQQEHNNWMTEQRSGIEDTAQAMKQQGQQALLGALGQPNYAQNYGNWANFDKQLNDYWFNQWQNRGGRKK